MPLPIIQDVYRVTFNWTGTESDINVKSVQHFKTAQIAADLVTDLGAAVQANQFGYTEDSCEANTCDVIRLDGTAATSHHNLANWTGTGGALDTVPSLGPLVLGSTGLRGPANRGRLFLPSVAEAVMSNGLLDAANATAMTTAWTGFLNALDAVAVEWGVASYQHATFVQYTAVTVPRKLGIIRRRRNRS
jgi:hypothetical protein